MPTLYGSTFPDGAAYPTIGPASTVVSVTSSSGLTSALSAAVPGQRIVLANGTYSGTFTLSGKNGTLTQGISIEAASPLGAVFASGSKLTINNSNHVTVKGLSFASDAAGDILSIRGTSHHCRITRCRMGPTSRTNSASVANYIYLADTPEYVRIDHNELRNKGTSGNVIRVYGDFSATGGCKHILIDHNHIYNVADEVGNDKECIRIGTSAMSRTLSYSVIERNRIEYAEAEPEVISIKMSWIRCTGNVVYQSAGGIVIRHGRNNLVADNYIVDTGTGTTASGGLTSGGYRFYDTDHTVQYNYNAKTIGTDHEAALLIDTGDAETDGSDALSAHWRVKRATVTRNVLVQCATGIQVGDNYTSNPSDIVLTDNVVAQSTNATAVQFIGGTTLVGTSTNTGNTYSTTPTLAGLTLGTDGIWRKPDYGPRITWLELSQVGTTGDLNDTDGTGQLIAGAADPDPEPEPDPGPGPGPGPVIIEYVQLNSPVKAYDGKLWYIGPLGDLRPLGSPSPGLEINPVRYGGIHQGLSGARIMDVTGHREEYTLQLDYLDRDEYVWLEALHYRMIPGPHYLINPLKRNRLTAQASRLSPAVNRNAGVSFTSLYTMDRDWPTEVELPGRSLRLSGWTGTSLAVEFDTQKLVPLGSAEALTASVYLKSDLVYAGVKIRVSWYDADKQFIRNDDITVDVGTGWERYWFTYHESPSFAASAKFSVILGLPSTAVYFAAPMLEAGVSAPSTWELGGAAPLVLLDQLPATSDRYPLRNVALTLLEA